MSLNAAESRLVGLSDSGLENFGETRLLPPVCVAFKALQEEARRAGFDLQIASGHRDFERQRVIWNAKLCGDRPVLDDRDEPIDLRPLPAADRLRCVMRFSALPGASRHHWGTEVDVFDRSAMTDGYRLQLSTGEVANNGIFGPLHAWLDQRIADGESFGFYRPYGQDRGAMAPERWHLSFAPLARGFQDQITGDLLQRAWASVTDGQDLVLRTDIEGELPSLLRRYVYEVDEPHEAARHFAP